MAEAETLTNLTPKQMGRHLRAVRRKKGLSLSEVARGAGLTRREMNAYEKGKVPVPDSDLFVIAGACGVEVSDLRPTVAPPALPDAGNGNGVARTDAGLFPSSVQDVISLLRRGRDLPAERHALEPRAVRRSLEAPESGPPLVEPGPAEPVDVFAELARLPEPLPLPPRGEEPDLFAPRPDDLLPPFGAVEELDDRPWDDWVSGEPGGVHELAPDDDDGQGERPVLVEFPVAADPEPPVTASDAPPIDVAARLDRLDPGWGRDPARGPEEPGASLDEAGSSELPTRLPGAAADAFGDPFAEPASAPSTEPASDPVAEPAPDPFAAWPPAAAATDEAWPAGPAGAGFPGEEWPAATAAGAFPGDEDDVPEPVTEDWPQPVTEDWSEPVTEDWPQPVTEDWHDPVTEDWPEPVTETWHEPVTEAWPEPVTEAEPAASPGAWEHEPDPAATSTGFFVDWGESGDAGGTGTGLLGGAPADPWPADGVVAGSERIPEPEAAAPTSEVLADEATGDGHPTTPLVDIPDWVAEILSEPIPGAAPDPQAACTGIGEPRVGDLDDDLGTSATTTAAPADEPPLISWHPVPGTSDGLWSPAPGDATDHESPTVGGPAVPEQFVVAGPEWEIGNAVPLVEVRGTGSLVMRRADERWALADITAPGDFAVEVFVDLRSGPGFGVLFRASVDGEGRMSGYSFDLDPVYEGGSYLVREWRADRELWNPIARAPMPDPTRFHGLLAVRLTVDDDRLVASVNGEVVLTVDDLRQASADRGRDGAGGDRVGIQAWSSTDLVIDEVRVARH